MSEFAQLSLGESLEKAWKHFYVKKKPRALYNVWIDASTRYNGYLSKYCEQKATICGRKNNGDKRNPTEFRKEIGKRLGILLTRFALLNR